MLIIVMMINAVGISQVSHICKMAASCGVEKDCCRNSENESQDASKSPDCCKDVIKYFHQQVDITIQQAYKIQPQHLFISLLIVPVSILEYRELISFMGRVDFQNEKPRKAIFLDLQTLLI